MAPGDIAGFGLSLAVIIMIIWWYCCEIGNRCKHSWEILSEVKTESYLEQYTDTTGNGISPLHTNALEHMCKRKLVQTFHCSKCGRLKRFVTTI